MTKIVARVNPSEGTVNTTNTTFDDKHREGSKIPEYSDTKLFIYNGDEGQVINVPPVVRGNATYT